MLLLTETEVEEFKTVVDKGATTAVEAKLELLLLLEALILEVAAAADLPNETAALATAPLERELDRLDLRLLEDITGEAAGEDEEGEDVVSPLSSGKSFGLVLTATATEATDGFPSSRAFEEELAEAEGLSLGLLAPSATVVVVLSPSLCSMSASKSMIRSPMLMSNSL